MAHHSCCCEHSFLEEQHYFPPSSCCQCDLGCNCSNGSVILNSINGFQVTMDLRHYKPGEVVVKTLHDTVVIEGTQKKDDNDKSRSFCVRPKFLRKYKLPRYYDPAKTTATFSSDGILIVTVAAPPPPEMTDKIVVIEDVGPFFESSKAKNGLDDKAEETKPSA